MEPAKRQLIAAVQAELSTILNFQINVSIFGALKRCFDNYTKNNDLMPPDISAHVQKLVDNKVNDSQMWMLKLIELVHLFIYQTDGRLQPDIHRAILQQYIKINSQLLSRGFGERNIEKCIIEAYILYVMQRARILGVA